ncbi:MAG TPA: valine--tRNA ligase [Thermoanaerobaculia bacterium]|jgi:valyl-tRNA synthetase|nr:valine--tRNA ligase [Thermoanaerobaculia bacterium]
MAFTKHFEHGEREPEIYKRWEESGAFGADPRSEKKPFTISMPPPNATGTLHLGHAIMLVLEDLMTRWHRMAGDEALWVPGTDHAAIATESVVIRLLQKEGIADPRGTLGRDELVRRIAEYVEKSRDTIRSQVRGMGSSCDWTRERYTMDAQLSRCVAEVFGKMFRDGLIYRGARIVNWDPGLQTTISDDEIEHVEQPNAKFYTLRYGPFLVGTSRPETKLGDTAVAVHPDDERWKKYIGEVIDVPWPKGPTIRIRVVADERVDPEFGTGALGVTPAHSQLDFEIAEDHGLPLIPVIGEDGRMLPSAGPYAGMTVLECREAFVADLDAAGLLAEVKTYPQRLSICYRSKQAIEPLIKAQWFIDVNKPAVRWKDKLMSLRQVLRDVVESGDIQLVPKHQEATYFNWIDNLHDWCVSRQIWWGHRIPVWYRGEQEIYVGHRGPGGEGWVQDTDTLDTWFSSALWTWSTLVDPELAKNQDIGLSQLLAGSPDFNKFHPTSVMETGYDILFFWVARMMLMTTYATGQVPFRTVYLHGLILDRDGEKMTKSKPETSIDPLDTIRDMGADPLRISMVIGNSAGTDFRLSTERLEAGKHLVNKLWNAAKLVEKTVQGSQVGENGADPSAVSHPVNRWMVARAHQTVDVVNGRLAAWSFGDAAEQIRSSFWSEFCDEYLEAVKVPELANLAETRAATLHVFDIYLRLFHPFIPFVTEDIWQELGRPGLLIRAGWPDTELRDAWKEDVEGVEAVLRLVMALRRIRSESRIEPKAQVAASVRALAFADQMKACDAVIRKMANLESLSWDGAVPAGAVTAVDPAFQVAVDLGEANREAERERLRKDLEDAERRLANVGKRLANEAFVRNAKPEIVEGARAEERELQGLKSNLETRLAELG